MRRILALTSIRSEYDLMSRLYRLLHADAGVELRLLVSGAHLSPAYGYTVEAIRRDGLPILAEIETLISADTRSSRLKTASGLLAAGIDMVARFAPDLIVYAGDREDVLVGAMLGTFLGIPTAHFFAGDHAADGHIDNPIRHATSKLSSLHFVSTPEHQRRLQRMGEPQRRIFVIGSVALDKFLHEPACDRAEVLDAIGAGLHARSAPLAVLIFHPVAEEIPHAASYIENAVHVLVAHGFHVCIGSPNTDPGNFGLGRAIERLALASGNEVTYYGNLERLHFVNLLRHASVIVGNSSAGILEAASLKLPAINIGLRQRGRLCGDNVVFTGGSRENIEAALEQVNTPEFRTGLRDLRNPYGDGSSSERAAALLKSLDLNRYLEKPEDPLERDD